jgi:hypothetical protein
VVEREGSGMRSHKTPRDWHGPARRRRDRKIQHFSLVNQGSELTMNLEHA